MGLSAGFVRLQFPTERTWDWMFPYYTQSDGVLVEAESAKRINLITSYEVRTAQLLPSLSLNRGAIGLRRRSSDVAELRNVEPPPFAEDTDWMPSVEEGIIIDDLDPGFVVFQPLPDLRSSTSIGPFGWFVEPRLQVDLDNGIPTMGSYWARDSEFRMPQGTWGRMIESTAYGKYRKTVATAWVRDKIHKARFTAELPESDKWKLAYHVPRAWRPGRGLDLQWELKIFDDNREWFVSFDLGSKTLGWNDIGVFDLEAGAVSVELVDVSKPTMIYADAIRWTKQGDS